jgi:transposase
LRQFPKDAPEKLRAALLKAPTKGEFQRAQCLWLRVGLKMKAQEVATALGWHVNSVRRLQSRYLREGEAALKGPGRGGRRRENLTAAAERALLKRLLEAARPNEVLEARAVQEAYEEAVGRPVGKSTIYKMLTRNGWRRVLAGRVIPARTWAPSRFPWDEGGPLGLGHESEVP